MLVAVDGSRNSVIAAGVGARIARLLDMHVGLVHVLDVPVLSFWHGVEARLKQDVSAQAETMLADIAARIRRSCDAEPKFYILDGEPAHAIVKLLRAHPGAVMLVAGREGLGSERRTELLRERAGEHLGARLADMLSVPVLLVPPNASASLICESLGEFAKPSAA